VSELGTRGWRADDATALSRGSSQCFQEPNLVPGQIDEWHWATDWQRSYFLADLADGTKLTAKLHPWFSDISRPIVEWAKVRGRQLSISLLAIGEFPDEEAAASAVLAAAAGASWSDVETTVAMTAKDAATTFESAGKAARELGSAGRS
jgi:hypothetical protein